MNELPLNITETKPTKLEQARRALADAERELELIEGRNCEDYAPYERAVQRCAEIVKQEEAAERDALKQSLARHACGNPHCLCDKCCREEDDAELSALPRLKGEQ